jgi:PleD family two-component response regulator
MSLQGPLIVVAERPATELTEALSAAGAFPIVETTWADAPTAFVAVKPAAVVIAEPGPPPSESSARMLCLQIATASGPIVPTIGLAYGESDAAIPVALPADASLPVARIVARLQSALRVRELHATVLRRYEDAAAQSGTLPQLPSNDALGEATVLIVGRGPLYPALTVAMGERVKMIGALSVENAARYLNARDIDGVVVGDGFPAMTTDAFLSALAQDTRFRDLPVAVIGETSDDFAEVLPNVDHLDPNPHRIVSRIVPLVRLHAFESRLKRALKSFEADGIFDVETGLLTREAFWRDLERAIAEAADRSQALSLARFSFEGPLDDRAALDGARLVTRLTRTVDFATRDEDGAILIAFTQTDLKSAHVVARRIAGLLKSTMLAPHRAHQRVTANVTLATLKAGDTLDTLMLRVLGSRMVAAE